MAMWETSIYIWKHEACSC